jgi:hypothetical protein
MTPLLVGVLDTVAPPASCHQTYEVRLVVTEEFWYMDAVYVVPAVTAIV